MKKRRGCCSIVPVLGAMIVGVTLCVIALAFAPKDERPVNLPPTFTPTITEFRSVEPPTVALEATAITYRVVLPVVMLAVPQTPSPVAAIPPTPLPTIAPMPTVMPVVQATPTIAAMATESRADGFIVSPFACVDGCAVAPDPSCAIKGNVNSDGERIYHEPGGRSYERTDIKPEEGDRWFCTEAEAVAAGFRAPEND